MLAKKSKKVKKQKTKKTMALTSTNTLTITSILFSFLFLPKFYSSEFTKSHLPVIISDVDLLEFPLNLEFLEAEFFLYGSLGHGLDKVAPNLTQGGPTPIGAKQANLDHFTQDIIKQFAFQEVGHLRFFSWNHYFLFSFFLFFIFCVLMVDRF